MYKHEFVSLSVLRNLAFEVPLGSDIVEWYLNKKSKEKNYKLISLSRIVLIDDHYFDIVWSIFT